RWQLRVEGRTEEIEGRQRAGRRDDFDARLVELDTSWRLRLVRDVSFDGNDRLVVELAQALDQRRIGDDDLGDALRVAQEQEADAAEPAQVVQPAGQSHAFADVAGEIGR